jgi:hypothetical protein
MDKIRPQDFLSFLLPGLLVSLAISFLFSYVVPLLPEGIRCQDEAWKKTLKKGLRTRIMCERGLQGSPIAECRIRNAEREA